MYSLSCSFRIALVGERAFGRGYGTEATRLVLQHVFATIGLHRVELEVYASNSHARHVYERAGFVHEGTKRDALYWDSSWIDAPTRRPSPGLAQAKRLTHVKPPYGRRVPSPDQRHE